MIGSNAIGSDAVGTSGASAGPVANLSCSLSASSTASASLTTIISFAAALSVAAVLTANLSAGQAPLSANLYSSASSVSNLTTKINLQAVLSAISALSADMTTQQVIPMFTPSAARTINVQATSPVFTGGKWWNLTDSKKPRGLKDPDATIDITFDWSSWLDDIGSVTISDVTFIVNGVSSVGSFSNGTQVTVFVSGGTAGSAATVSCMITTLSTPSRTDERTIYLDIADE